MEPIRYFNTFEEGKDEFLEAMKKNDTHLKLEAIRKMGKAAVAIVQKNYQTQLLTLFKTEGSKDHEDRDTTEMYTNWTFLIEENQKYLALMAKTYNSLAQGITEAIELYKASKISSGENAENLLNAFKSPRFGFLPYLLNGIECLVEGIPAPYSTVSNIIKTFHKDSFFLKEEELIINSN